MSVPSLNCVKLSVIGLKDIRPNREEFIELECVVNLLTQSTNDIH